MKNKSKIVEGIILNKFLLKEAYTVEVPAPTYNSTATSPVPAQNTEELYFSLPENSYLKKLTDNEKQHAKELLYGFLVNSKSLNITFSNTSFGLYILESLVGIYLKEKAERVYNAIHNLLLPSPKLLIALYKNTFKATNKSILYKSNQRYKDYIFNFETPPKYIWQLSHSIYEGVLKNILTDKVYKPKTKNYFIALFVSSFSRKLADQIISYQTYWKREKEKEEKSKNIDKGFLYKILKDPESSKRFTQANAEIENMLNSSNTKKTKSKASILFNLLTSGFEAHDIIEDFPKIFKNTQQLKDVFVAIRKGYKDQIEAIYKKHGFTENEINFDDFFKAKYFKQDKSHEKKTDDFNGLFELRKVIRKILINEIFKSTL